MGFITNTNGLSCCGVIEISGISKGRSAEGVLKDLFGVDDYDSETTAYLPSEAPHYIFTQAGNSRARKGYGYELAAYILKHGLGTVSGSTPARNPNSGRYVTVFTWTIDKPAITRWGKKVNKKNKSYPRTR